MPTAAAPVKDRSFVPEPGARFDPHSWDYEAGEDVWVSVPGKGWQEVRLGKDGKLPKLPAEDRCLGRKPDGTGYCGTHAGQGTGHVGTGRCARHGGKTPLHERSADIAIAEDAVRVYGLPKATDPHSALLDELARTNGHVLWLFLKVQEVGEEDLVGPVGQEGPSESGGYHHAEYQPSVWLRQYLEERKHFVAVAKACVSAGIEERRVRIAEAQGMLFVQAIKGILEDLGVSDHPEVGAIVRKHLMAIKDAGSVDSSASPGIPVEAQG